MINHTVTFLRHMMTTGTDASVCMLFPRIGIPSFRQIFGVEADHTMAYGLHYDAGAAIEPLGDTLYLSSFPSDRSGEGVVSAEMSRQAVVGE